ncbi:metalloregulator ArsR/SmtB family transcription factor [Pelagibacterium sp. H642]|uniref:ArsR/SmtB family transcription factor n=1 Tax=Pelagibacterium sp. H642 TaxID=1881069 RepID=UPI0028165071|nr:metalloregulator ArsR/SmtB family transcription factor [Pelagibacterium sp. H642]WMT89867.1 metalloregulator ArsR/SmtB family transcription factor [Pelagibacterium sp. H642]
MTEIGVIGANSVVSTQDRNSVIFTAISDPHRRAIVERLARNGPMTVGELSTPFAISAPAISRHLKVLEAAGVVRRTVDRQWRVCQLELAGLRQVRSWLETVLTAND